METSPVPPEWQGSPKVMFVIDSTLNMDHDFQQAPITGATRIRFIQLIENILGDEWYITPLVKCRPLGSTYTVKNLNVCTEWIKEEISRLGPQIIVGCGTRVEKYVKCNYVTMSPTRIVQGRKNELLFEELLIKIKGDLCRSIITNMQY